MPGGYAGKFLEVDLTKGKIKVFSNTSEPGLSGLARRLAAQRHKRPIELAGAAARKALRRGDPYRSTAIQASLLPIFPLARV